MDKTADWASGYELLIETGAGPVLTELVPSDLPALTRYANDPVVYRFTENIPYPFSRKDGLAFLGKVDRARQRYRRPVHFAIRHPETGEFAGTVMRLMTCGMGGCRDEIGYWMGAPFRGRGWMSASVSTFCAYWLAESPLIRITAMVDPENQASVRVLEKAGFFREAYLPQFTVKEAKPLDAIQMTRLKELQ